MHGRKKLDKPPSESELTNLQRKTDLYSQTVTSVLTRKKLNDFSSDSFELTAKVLKSNPDFYSIWNFRKEILISMLPELSTSVEDRHQRLSNDEIRDLELKMSEDCIRKNPKSYGAWHHRQWILERMQGNYQSELDLCRLFLLEDQRNFHCWCYRRLVVQIGDIQPKDEFDFSTEKIDENFSNYSAYHHRSVYIQKLGIRSKDVIETEFSIIENAIYTEPDDQSSWWYHQFLLTWMSQQHQNNGDEKLSEADWSSWYQSILEKQIKVMEALLEVEPSSKWAMCSLTMMLGLILNLFCEENPVIVPDSGVHSTVDLLSERRQTLLTILCEVDPFHANRYKYLRRKKYAICTSVNVL